MPEGCRAGGLAGRGKRRAAGSRPRPRPRDRRAPEKDGPPGARLGLARAKDRSRNQNVVPARRARPLGRGLAGALPAARRSGDAPPYLIGPRAVRVTERRAARGPRSRERLPSGSATRCPRGSRSAGILSSKDGALLTHSLDAAHAQWRDNAIPRGPSPRSRCRIPPSYRSSRHRRHPQSGKRGPVACSRLPARARPFSPPSALHGSRVQPRHPERPHR